SPCGHRLSDRPHRDGVPHGASRHGQRRRGGAPVPGGGTTMTPEPLELGVGRGEITHHVLSVLVENKAGVLSRVAGLFARRGFNIYSLAVAPADESRRFSRITIVVDAASAPLEQVVRQLDKLVNVLDIAHVNESSVIARELLLATVVADADRQLELVQLCSAFGAEVVDVSS